MILKIQILFLNRLTTGCQRGKKQADIACREDTKEIYRNRLAYSGKICYVYHLQVKHGVYHKELRITERNVA